MPALRRISRVGLTSVWSWSSTPVRHRSSISISRLSITVATFRERSWTLSLAWMYLAWDQIGFIEIMWCEEHRMAEKHNKKIQMWPWAADVVAITEWSCLWVCGDQQHFFPLRKRLDWANTLTRHNICMEVWKFQFKTQMRNICSQISLKVSML